MDDARDEQIRSLQLMVELLGRQVMSLSHRVQQRDRDIRRLEEDNRVLRQRLAEQRPPDFPSPGSGLPGALPPFIKPPVSKRRPRRPGRPLGHEPAMRPPPPKVDRTVEVPLARGSSGRCVCPHCRGALSKLKRHRRLVEDLIPAKVVVTRYDTRSGWCPACGHRVESRHPEQPPAANVPQAQVGVNAMATAAVLRLCNRLPLRQVSQVLEDLPGFKLCAGAVTRQIQRLGDWLSGEYERLKRRLRSADVVHADETSWRIAGRNDWLWTICDSRHTLYHIDTSRSGRVIRRLLGGAFGGTLVSDFYSAYNTVNCPKQKCLAHLLRELHETAARSPPFAEGLFYRRVRRLVHALLNHKQRREELPEQAYTRRGLRLEQRLADLADEHLHDADADTQRLAQRLTRHRAELTSFLWHREVQATNNAAERALRPMVVSRKISGGSRSPRGAKATAIVASVLYTARQQGRDVLATLKQLMMDCWADKEPGQLLA